MKLIILVLLAIYARNALALCSPWKERMAKYGALVYCDYFVSSVARFSEDFHLEEIESQSLLQALNQPKNYSHILHFYIIGQNEIKFRLFQGPLPVLNEQILRFVISDETYINNSEGGFNLVSLATKNIVRKDEPNEILLEIFDDNRLKLFVNGIVTINTRTIANILEMDYFSFATTIDGESQELFYNCSP